MKAGTKATVPTQINKLIGPEEIFEQQKQIKMSLKNPDMSFSQSTGNLCSAAKAEIIRRLQRPLKMRKG